MILAGLLAGGTLYLGTRLYQYFHKPKPLIEKLLSEEEVQHQSRTWFAKNRIVPGLLIGGGLVVAGSALWLAISNGVMYVTITNRLIYLLRNRPYGPALYLLTYAARTLVFFPTTLMTLAAGILLGPAWGMLYSMVGMTLAAIVAYGIGSRLRRQGQSAALGDSLGGNWQVIEPYVERMQANPFTTVVAMHLFFAPFDLFNYASGILGLDWWTFIIATVLGSAPGTLALVLAGASIQSGIITGVPSFDPVTLAASAAIFLGILALSPYFSPRDTIDRSGGERDHEALLRLPPQPMSDVIESYDFSRVP